MALGKEADWRWLRDREDSPWYPSMRLFRQKTWGGWDEVFQRIAHELGERVTRARGHALGSLTRVVRPSELLDRMTALEAARDRLERDDRGGVEAQLQSLAAARTHQLPASVELGRRTAELRAVHELLLRTEDALRRLEREADFGPRFVETTRTWLQTEERRGALLQQIEARWDG